MLKAKNEPVSHRAALKEEGCRHTSGLKRSGTLAVSYQSFKKIKCLRNFLVLISQNNIVFNVLKTIFNEIQSTICFRGFFFVLFSLQLIFQTKK